MLGIRFALQLHGAGKLVDSYYVRNLSCFETISLYKQNSVKFSIL
jgi:hypothetical protein